MSTRCNIVALEADGSRYPCMIYKHCDGYPEGEHGVMAWLVPLVQRFHKERGDDTEYCVAQILRHQAVADFQRRTPWTTPSSG